jgi:hypothetical protein
MGAALCLLEDSLSPGRHEATVKHSAVRKVRTVFSNIWGVTPACNDSSLVWLTNYKKKRSVTAKSPTVSEWFTHFGVGLKNRMGSRIKQDAAIIVEVLLEMMEQVKRDYSLAEANLSESLHIAQTACFCLYSYCASLRAFEVPKVVLDYLPDFMQTTTVGAIPPYFGLPLEG